MSDQNSMSQPQPKSAAAIVALVLGIIGLVSSWVPIVNSFSFFFVLIGIVFGIVGLVGTLRGKKSGKAMAIASLLVCVIACAIVLATQSAYSKAIDEATKGAVSSSSGSSVTGTDAAATGTEPASGDAAKYSIEGEEFVTDAYNCKIVGIYTNKSGAKQNYVQVSYTLFDADGNQIGTAFANTSNLDDGGTWKFEASTLKSADEIATWKFSEVSAW
ncbi:FxLYD domain-containing protein [Paratractidigestivibacter sp.]|uniref:FxLYD domain-containing protein n=1 Tax=Paratractidigestivibacter sp. TaxID=2847316 RepID=UPI002ABE77A6|nr:FxLYD domain-containing protein [Paratractidigestivibacter sp.]